jgi:hypothetical protein
MRGPTDKFWASLTPFSLTERSPKPPETDENRKLTETKTDTAAGESANDQLGAGEAKPKAAGADDEKEKFWLTDPKQLRVILTGSSDQSAPGGQWQLWLCWYSFFFWSAAYEIGFTAWISPYAVAGGARCPTRVVALLDRPSLLVGIADSLHAIAVRRITADEALTLARQSCTARAS